MFRFDHIYAFEIRNKVPSAVFERLPSKWMPAYHWINIGVSADRDSPYNPLSTILKTFDKDVFIVVKLDVDTPSVEIPLAYQILEDPEVYERIDQFYFEHHVHLLELARAWGSSMNGTIGDSLRLFRGLREKGVPAHFWP